MEWLNAAYEPNERRRLSPVQPVRVGAVQYHMRRVGSFEEFASQVEFFVDTASDYHCDFLVFPELFTLQLLSITPATRPGLAARFLADFTPRYLELRSRRIVKNAGRSVGGSHFKLEKS